MCPAAEPKNYYHCTEHEREIISSLKAAGMKLSVINRIVPWPSIRTIKRIIAQSKTGPNTNKIHGRPGATTVKEDSQILKTVFNDRKNLKIMTKNVRKALHRRLSLSLVRRRILAKGVEYTKKRFVPKLTPDHIKKRLEFCETYKKIDWSHVVFSDETTIELGSQSKFHWRFPGENDDTPKTKFAQKQMFWGAISMDGKSTLIPLSGSVNSAHYIDVLNDNLLPYLQQLPKNRRYLFQQDNAPAHNAKRTKAWLNEQHVQIISWPPNSPDLNPIENLWGILKRRIEDKNPKTKTDLITTALKEWEKLPLESVKNVTKSMPHRISQVQQRGGMKCDY